MVDDVVPVPPSNPDVALLPDDREPPNRRGALMLVVALATSFLAVSILVLGLALSRDRSGTTTASVTLDSVDNAQSGRPDAATDTSQDLEGPVTEVAEPDRFEVPFEWSADGLEMLPFGTLQDEAIAAMTEALGEAPDEVEEWTGGECTPGTDAQWDQREVRLSFDPAGHLASASFPADLGRTAAGAAETLGDLRSMFPDLEVENVPPQPEFGIYESFQAWSVEGGEGTASGSAEGNQSQSPVESVRLNSERFVGVECFE